MNFSSLNSESASKIKIQACDENKSGKAQSVRQAQLNFFVMG